MENNEPTLGPEDFVEYKSAFHAQVAALQAMADAIELVHEMQGMTTEQVILTLRTSADEIAKIAEEFHDKDV